MAPGRTPGVFLSQLPPDTQQFTLGDHLQHTWGVTVLGLKLIRQGDGLVAALVDLEDEEAANKVLDAYEGAGLKFGGVVAQVSRKARVSRLQQRIQLEQQTAAEATPAHPHSADAAAVASSAATAQRRMLQRAGRTGRAAALSRRNSSDSLLSDSSTSNSSSSAPADGSSSHSHIRRKSTLSRTPSVTGLPGSSSAHNASSSGAHNASSSSAHNASSSRPATASSRLTTVSRSSLMHTRPYDSHDSGSTGLDAFRTTQGAVSMAAAAPAAAGAAGSTGPGASPAAPILALGSTDADLLSQHLLASMPPLTTTALAGLRHPHSPAHADACFAAAQVRGSSLFDSSAGDRAVTAAAAAAAVGDHALHAHGDVFSSSSGFDAEPWERGLSDPPWQQPGSGSDAAMAAPAAATSEWRLDQHHSTDSTAAAAPRLLAVAAADGTYSQPSSGTGTPRAGSFTGLEFLSLVARTRSAAAATGAATTGAATAAAAAGAVASASDPWSQPVLVPTDHQQQQQQQQYDSGSSTTGWQGSRASAASAGAAVFDASWAVDTDNSTPFPTAPHQQDDYSHHHHQQLGDHHYRQQQQQQQQQQQVAPAYDAFPVPSAATLSPAEAGTQGAMLELLPASPRFAAPAEQSPSQAYRVSAAAAGSPALSAATAATAATAAAAADGQQPVSLFMQRPPAPGVPWFLQPHSAALPPQHQHQATGQHMPQQQHQQHQQHQWQGLFKASSVLAAQGNSTTAAAARADSSSSSIDQSSVAAAQGGRSFAGYRTALETAASAAEEAAAAAQAEAQHQEAAAAATEAQLEELRHWHNTVTNCLVCRATPRSVVLFPCKHLALCDACVAAGSADDSRCGVQDGGSSTWQQWQCCPLCGAAVEDFIPGVMLPA